MNLDNQIKYNRLEDTNDVTLTTQPTSPPAYSQPVVHQPTTNPVTVVVQQPSYILPFQTAKKQWSSKKCDCCNDVRSCLCAFFCTSIFVGLLSQRMGESCCVPSCVPGGIIAMRSAFRERHNIQGSIMQDCCDLTCCSLCSVCQMSREMDVLGYPSNDCC